MPCDAAGARVPDADRMQALGAAFGQSLGEFLSGGGIPADAQPASGPGRAAVVYLEGPLGAGKTTFARGILRTLGVTGAIKSPTYTLLEPYATDFGPVAHFDLYRVSDVEEVEYLGMREYLDRGACLFEWPERARGGLPPADVRIVIGLEGTARRLDAFASSGLGRALLAPLISSDLLQESVSNT